MGLDVVFVKIATIYGNMWRGSGSIASILEELKVDRVVRITAVYVMFMERSFQ